MKENHVNNPIPIACVPLAMTDKQREKYKKLREELADLYLNASELPNGFALSFPAESTMITKLAEFILLERLCCPFLHFELRVEPNRPVYIQLTGAEGVKEFLKAEFTTINLDCS